MVGLQSGTRAVVLGLLSGVGLFANVIGAPQAEFRGLYALNPSGHIVIQNLYGDVRITSWDRGQVLVTAIKKSADPRRLNDAQIVVDSTPELVSIHTQYAGSDVDHPASVEYHIVVPRTANLDNIRLTNGELTLSGLAGPVKASSINGSIKAENLEGQADLSTINGQLEAGFNRLAPEHTISLSSVNGPIHLSIPAGASAVLDAHNLSGGIDTDFGRSWRASSGHRLHTIVNSGGAHILVHNLNGGISIRSAWYRRSERPWS